MAFGKERLRRIDPRQHDRIAFVGKRVAGDGVGQLGYRADVAGNYLVELFLGLAAHREHVAGALVRLPRRIVDGSVAFDDPGVDAEVADAAHVGVGHGLEHESGHGRVGLGLARLSVLRLCRRSVERGRPRRNDRVGQPVDPDKRSRRADHHGEDGGLRESVVQRGQDLLAR